MEYIRNEILRESSHKQLKIAVLGVGATGSHIVMELIKLGFTDISIVDTGLVKEHNITNQVYPLTLIGKNKAEALKIITHSRYESNLQDYDEDRTYDIVFNCVDEYKSRQHFRDTAQWNRLFIETAFDVYSSDLFMMTSKPLLSSIPTGQGNTSEVTSACGSRLSVSASIQGFIGFVIWGLINHLNNDLDVSQLNSRLTFMSFNPIASIPITEKSILIFDEKEDHELPF